MPILGDRLGWQPNDNISALIKSMAKTKACARVTYVKAVPKLQHLLSWGSGWIRSEQSLPSLPEHTAHEEVHERAD